jgi:parallel beta-helix repeat protein
MNTRNITLVLTCIFLLFGTWFISFSLSNANFSVSNTSLASTHTIYVDGNNAGDPSQDGSSSHPFSTIQRGIDKSSAGDTVFVRKGYYYETMTISNSLNLVGEDMNNTIIDAINTMTSGYVVHIQSNVNDVNISGFTIQNARVNPRYGIYAEWYNRNVNIFRNRIFLNDQGIFTSHSSNITITNNEILNNTLGVNINWEDLYANVSNNTISGLWPPIGSKAISIG